MDVNSLPKTVTRQRRGCDLNPGLKELIINGQRNSSEYIVCEIIRQSNEASILLSHHEETRELPGETDNARNNARCTKARKTTHGLDGQHQDVDRTPRGRVSQNDNRGHG